MPRKLVPRRFVSGTFPPAQAESRARCEAAWRQLLAEPALRQRLDLPGQLLSEYFRERRRSRLGKLVNTANAWPDWCETVVIVAPHGAALAGRALFAAVAHPFYNHLPPGGRGGRPRVHFVEPTLDHDRLQAVFDLLKAGGDDADPHDRWALVDVVDDSSPELAETVASLAAPLRDGPQPRRLTIAAEPHAGDVAAWDGPFFLQPTALLAVTAVGADVVQQLKGAVWFVEQAKSAAPHENEAVQLAEFVSHGPVEIVVWHHALERLACGFAQQGGGDLCVVAGHRPASRRELLHPRADVRRLHLLSETIRCDRLGAGELRADREFGPNADGSIDRFVPAPESLVAAQAEVRQAEAAAGAPSAEIRLARLHDPALGELSAWLSTALAMHDRLSRP